MPSLFNLSFKSKILTAAGVWAAMTAVAAGAAYLEVKVMVAAQERLSHSEVASAGFHRLLNIVLDMETGIRGFVLSGDTSYLQPFSDAEGLFDGEAQSLKTHLTGSQDQDQAKILEEIVANKKTWMEGPIMEIMMARRKATAKMITLDAMTQVFRSSKSKELTDAMRKSVDSALARERERRSVAVKDCQSAAKSAKFTLVWGLGFGIVTGLAILFALTSYLSRVIRRSINSLEANASEILRAAKDLQSMSVQLNSETQSASAAFKTVVSSIEQICQETNTNASHSQEAGTVAADGLQVAKKGEADIQTLIGSMQEISQSSKQMADIINVIDDIAFQTNLLALNAAVEAARVGEQGKGFAVVADAVRSLSQRTADSAKGIADLIRANEQRIEKGRQAAELSGVVLKEILDSIRKSAGLSQFIAEASKSQTLSLSELSKGISTLEQGTQRNECLAKRNSESGEIVLGQVDSLQAIVHSLTEAVQGAHIQQELKDAAEEVLSQAKEPETSAVENPAETPGEDESSLTHRVG